ncbi:2-dehydropantoate 2-reductase [Gordonia neofelifaecis NRRL B-59395]|uniref:2-dehydropantoate 2-reductase n=2 Tax=Gordonia TaxID=2053 RepID=F1YME2_9ACTN|nr:2-dehydropantoate 2-reductase [Gordonia neofelifaecis NRRL B-59395]
MGSVYAARLARAGHDVIIVDAWAEHVAAITAQGLHITGPDGDFVAAIQAFTTIPDSTVDLVVLAVKAADVRPAATELGGLIGPDTLVLTIQNGLGPAEIVADHVGSDRLIVGIAKGFGASLVGPGQAHHNAMRALRFGAYGGLDPQRVETVAAAWRLGGFDAESVADINAMQWEKLICNVAYSAPCALTGMTVGQILDDEQMSRISSLAATEAWQVARAAGVAVHVADPVEFARDFGAQMPNAKPSALLDIEAGRVSEIGFINGAVPREGAKVGLSAPVNTTLTALVNALESKSRT